MGARGRDEGGYVFTLAIVALVVLLALGAVSLQLAMQSSHRAAMERDTAVAFNLAEAGADAAEAWLRSQTTPPAGGAIDPLGGEHGLTGGTYRAVIVPDGGNAGAWAKSYTITATGQATRHGITKQVIMRVQQQSFALYAYFTDQERSSVTNGTIWFYPRDRLYGPAHSNDQVHVTWDAAAADSIFHDTLSSHAATVAWSPRAPGNTNEWRRVLTGGQSALTLGVDYIPLPTTSDEQKIAGWGADSGFPSGSGVHVPAAGTQLTAGIYISGDSQIELSVDGETGNQIIAVTQGAKTTTITADLRNCYTTVADGTPGSPHRYTGLLNGMIYCSGNITSLRGAIANNYENGSAVLRRNMWTIATNVAAGKNITITDDLAYQTMPDLTRPPTYVNNLRAPTLGLVANNIVVASNCPNEETIDGVMLANGSFYYDAWDTIKRSNLHILGGIIQRKRGPVGTFSNNNVQISGYNKDYRYDPRMVDYPPPFFPTTGQYDVKSWQYK